MAPSNPTMPAPGAPMLRITTPASTSGEQAMPKKPFGWLNFALVSTDQIVLPELKSQQCSEPSGAECVNAIAGNRRRGTRALVKPKIILIRGGILAGPNDLAGWGIEAFELLDIAGAMEEEQFAVADDGGLPTLSDIPMP